MNARFVGGACAALVRLIGCTWRVREIGLLHAETARGEGGGVLFTLWHEHLFPLAFLGRNLGIVVLISQHRDGELIAHTVQRLGFGTVRGSTTRGGFRALIEMARLGRAGSQLAITPDGPRGPRRSAQVGGLIIAQRSGIPLVPIGVAGNPVKRLDSWDRFMIPHLFARVVVGYGDPLWIPTECKPDELEREWLPRLNAGMEALQERLDGELKEWTGHGCDRS